ncbi:MAG: UdgX family uracil-DNA binding protein [Actinomycetota bacterium]|nr:UdgX family uracil-DNA binding protein [Actinomycetota bacterium]
MSSLSQQDAAGLERPAPPVPDQADQQGLRAAAQTCKACDLWEGATQAVTGEGAVPARLMLVGEQPGDREDIQGHPFAGPAGAVLDRGLEGAGIARQEVYITNVVKHFRFKARGRRRIHQSPDRWQVTACLPWLRAELELVHPEALVCLGATAAQALLGAQVRIGRDRGRPLESALAEHVSITAHPSSILRAREDADRDRAMEQFVQDLRQVAGWLSAR